MSKRKEFGVALKAYRVAANEKLDDLADAMEVAPETIKKMEKGEQLPTLDILEMFISHFSLRDTEASRLWELAGFSLEEDTVMNNDSKNDAQPKEVNVHMPADMQILYTDMVHVAGNNYGVVINFIQGGGANGKPTVVNRVGMSKDHALSLIDVLKKGVENLDK